MKLGITNLLILLLCGCAGVRREHIPAPRVFSFEDSISLLVVTFDETMDPLTVSGVMAFKDWENPEAPTVTAELRGNWTNREAKIAELSDDRFSARLVCNDVSCERFSLSVAQKNEGALLKGTAEFDGWAKRPKHFEWPGFVKKDPNQPRHQDHYRFLQGKASKATFYLISNFVLDVAGKEDPLQSTHYFGKSGASVVYFAERTKTEAGKYETKTGSYPQSGPVILPYFQNREAYPPGVTNIEIRFEKTIGIFEEYLVQISHP